MIIAILLFCLKFKQFYFLNFRMFQMCHRDGEPSIRVTNEDLQKRIDLVQKQLEEQRLMFSELKDLVRGLKDAKEKA